LDIKLKEALKPMSARPEAVKPPAEIRYTLAEAFDYFHLIDESIDPSSNPLNQERAIRAVAFLMEWMSQHANENVPGCAAHGLAAILEYTVRGGL
jgi:hypothetical protein